MQIFYDGLGSQDRYLSDAASINTFICKCEDNLIELIETVVENSYHSATKLFGRGTTWKGQLIDAKSANTDMLLERIEKMVGVQNLLVDGLNIRNGS